MNESVDFLAGLLDEQEEPVVGWEDMQGAHAAFLAACQRAGFLASQPSPHPVPTCPRCYEGVPYPIEGRLLCNACFDIVDAQVLQCWRLAPEAFFGWLAGQLHLLGGVRRLGGHAWQLGTRYEPEGPCECFYVCGGSPDEEERRRLLVYRNAVVLYGAICPEGLAALPVTLVALSAIVGLEECLTAQPGWERFRGAVRFDEATGRLYAGGVPLGDVLPGSREHCFLSLLARQQGRYVAYADIRSEVLRRTGGRDSRDDASFCHRLKSRLKQASMPGIDAVLATSNRAEGYLLRHAMP